MRGSPTIAHDLGGPAVVEADHRGPQTQRFGDSPWGGTPFNSTAVAWHLWKAGQEPTGGDAGQVVEGTPPS
jgi:hypothetical protein